MDLFSATAVEKGLLKSNAPTVIVLIQLNVVQYTRSHALYLMQMEAFTLIAHMPITTKYKLN